MRAGWDRLAARFRALFDKSSLDDDFSEELAFHLEESTSDNIRKGMTPREARRQAHIELGGVEQVRELHRETRGIQWVDNALRDLRFAMRQFLKSPGFSILVILALALGIGTCTTIYSVMQATVLSPLPVREQDRLFVLWENNLERDIDRFSVSIPNFSDYRDQSDTVDGFFAMRGASATVTIGETPERLEAMQVSVGSMSVMGWEPILGREFAPGEDEVGAPRVVMISERFWRSHFETDREILETLVTIDGQAHAIVGVFSDETFILNGKVHLWKPLIEDPRRDTRDNHDLTVCGRLKNGVSLDQAQAEMDTIAESLRKAYPDSNKGWGVALEPLYDMYIPVELRSGMAMLFCAVGVLLLIACANVANLLLSRASTREREIAVRVALGARRVRVVGQLMWESGLYSAFGAVGGLLVAYWGVFLIRVFAPEDLPRAESIALDWRALVFAALACVATVALSGLYPALRSSKTQPIAAIGAGSRALGLAPSKSRLRSLLVVCQLALSMGLVTGAGLLVKSFGQLQDIDPGFNATGVATFRITPDGTRYGETGPRIRFFQELIDRIASLPGVSNVGITSAVPFGPGRTSLNVFSLDPSAIAAEESIQAAWRIVSPKYFDTMEIPVIEGRSFTRFDTHESERVIIISQELAERFWPGESALGKRLSPGSPDHGYTVVGVVGSARIRSLTRSENPAMFFSSWHWSGWETMNFVVKTNQSPGSIQSGIRALLQDIDPVQPLFDFRTLEEFVTSEVQAPRLNSWLLSIFASVALVLASIGVYGVIASSVSQRANEIGVRMAMGARRGSIVSMIVRQGALLLVAGLAIGGVFAWQFTRIIQSQLYGVDTSDVSVRLISGVALALCALCASLLPALRATRMEPLRALRIE